MTLTQDLARDAVVNRGRPETRRHLNFSLPYLPCQYVQSDRFVSLPGRSIIVNPTAVPVAISAEPGDLIAPFGAAMLTDATIFPEHGAVAIGVSDLGDTTQLSEAPGWSSLSDIAPDLLSAQSLQLYRSPKDDLGEISVLPKVLSSSLPSAVPARWRISVNLWFAPGGTECLIHNRHDFLEFHVQIAGVGSMEKFHDPERSALYEVQHLAPGASHRIYAVREDDDGYLYPWHQYHAATDCVWLAVEYSPLLPDA